MAKEKIKKKAKEPELNGIEIKPLDESTRFRYIGFDVYGKSDRDFFKSEAEKKQHEKAVEKYRSEHYSPFRAFTAVNQNLLPFRDKFVLTISSIVMIIAAFLPWLSFKSNWVSLSFPGLFGFFKASQYSSIINMFNPRLMMYVYVPTLLALAGVVIGIITLVLLWSSSKSYEAYLARLKKFMRLGWVVLALWMLFFIISIIGISLPFGDWMAENYGVRGVGATVNIVSFATLSGIGVWMSIAALLLNSVKANEF